MLSGRLGALLNKIGIHTTPAPAAKPPVQIGAAGQHADQSPGHAGRSVVNKQLSHALKDLPLDQTSSTTGAASADQPKGVKHKNVGVILAVLAAIGAGIAYLYKKGKDVQGAKETPDPQAAQKDAVINSMVRNDAGVDTGVVAKTLRNYPLSMMQKVKDQGVHIRILKDNPGPGDAKPSDLGFGDASGKTADGRSWNEVSGGYSEQTKTLYLKASILKDGSEYGPNTILHEFGHAVDHSYRGDSRYAKTWSAKVDGLYADAKAGKPGHAFLDGYAAENKDEYLATSVGAYFNKQSHWDDTSNDQDTAYWPDNENRARQQKKDPDMFAFLDAAMTKGVQPN